MSLDEIRTWVEIAEGVATTLAFAVASLWGYYRFLADQRQKYLIRAERETAITPSLTPRLLACGEESQRMLEIRSRVTNNGKVPCVLDLSQSYMSVALYSGAHADQTTNPENLEPIFEPIYKKKLLGDVNIPVGASTTFIQVTVVPHPGVYNVEAFFAQTYEDAIGFYKRIGKTAPADLKDNPSGWPDQAVVSTLE